MRLAILWMLSLMIFAQEGFAWDKLIESGCLKFTQPYNGRVDSNRVYSIVVGPRLADGSHTLTICWWGGSSSVDHHYSSDGLIARIQDLTRQDQTITSEMLQELRRHFDSNQTAAEWYSEHTRSQSHPHFGARGIGGSSGFY